MGYTIRAGIKQGHQHVLHEINRQDALRVQECQINAGAAAVGIVCDGCGSSLFSEVGAQLAVEFLTRQAVDLLMQDFSASMIPKLLYRDAVKFLKGLTRLFSFTDPADLTAFINDNLLFTIIGFVLTPTEAVIFSSGDGTVVINDERLFIDQDNRPSYIGYQLVDRQFLKLDSTLLPAKFEVIELDLANTHRFAVGSDAWHSVPELLDEVWGFKNRLGLQRRMTIWSREKRFDDDVSLITVEFNPAEDQPAPEPSLSLE